MKLSRRNFLRTILYTPVLLAGGTGFIASQQLEVLRRDIAIENLPSELDGLKIGVMADFHAGVFSTEKVIQKAFHAIQDAQPDIIFLLGDYVDGTKSHSKNNLKTGAYIFEMISKLQARFGVYGVLGNHDHWIDADSIANLLTEAGVTLLKNKAVQLRDHFFIAGVDDYWEGPSRPDITLKDVAEEDIVLMLSHNPDVNILIEKKDPRIKLIVAGHTHGGQIRIPFTDSAPWVPCSPKYRGRTGVLPETPYRFSFISKGVGTFFVPVRINCPPDIGVLRLVKNKGYRVAEQGEKYS